MKKYWVIGTDQAGEYVAGYVEFEDEAKGWEDRGYEIVHQKDKPYIW